MANATSKLRRGTLIDPLQKKIDKKLSKKGVFADDRKIKKEGEAKEASRLQREEIGQQRIKENIRLAEADDDIGRAKLLRKTGGRRSLIASS